MIDEASHSTELGDFMFPMAHQRGGTNDKCCWNRRAFHRIEYFLLFDRIHTELKKSDRRDSLAKSRETQE